MNTLPDKNEFENYLHQQIPIARAMEVSAVTLTKELVVLSAPIRANRNHKKSAFGGSLSAVATLACWSLLYLNLLEMPGRYEIVIARNQTFYRKPVVSDLLAISKMCDSLIWKQFTDSLNKRGAAKIKLHASIGDDALLFEGVFAVVTPSV